MIGSLVSTNDVPTTMNLGDEMKKHHRTVSFSEKDSLLVCSLDLNNMSGITGSGYAQRMIRLSQRIFTEYPKIIFSKKEQQAQHQKFLRFLDDRPHTSGTLVSENYYPRYSEMYHLMEALRNHGLFRSVSFFDCKDCSLHFRFSFPTEMNIEISTRKLLDCVFFVESNEKICVLYIQSDYQSWHLVANLHQRNLEFHVFLMIYVFSRVILYYFSDVQSKIHALLDEKQKHNRKRSPF